MSGGGVVTLRRGRAKPLWAGHPWVYAASVERVTGDPADGDEVTVRDDEGRFLGRGFYNSRSTLRVRLLTRRDDGASAADLVAERIRDAVDLRRETGVAARGSLYRVVHGDGDGLPGLVVDRVGDWLVVQVSVLGAERLLDAVAEALGAALRPRGILLRGGARHAREEGISLEDRVLRGEEPPEVVEATEDGVRFGVDIRRGAKTGHFCDQRDNRVAFAGLCRGRRVLDAFSATGGFGLHALVQGGAARVLAVDGSAPALERLLDNASRNGVADRVETLREDVFLALRRLEGSGERFGAVSVDPPRMASSKARTDRALGAYEEVHYRALLLLEEGGVLCTTSCSGAVEEEAWEGTLREAARRARRQLQVVRRGSQGADHPWSPVAPEGRYLKNLLLRVLALR